MDFRGCEEGLGMRRRPSPTVRLRSRGGVRGELKRLAERLKPHGLRALVLFGSHVRGEALPNSDVDLVVVAEGLQGGLAWEGP